MSTDKMIPAKVFQDSGRKGGKRSMVTMSDRARRARAKKAAKARWAKKKENAA